MHYGGYQAVESPWNVVSQDVKLKSDKMMSMIGKNGR
jgi:hypothetical protein